MSNAVDFDPRFDFRTDSGGGDPDAESPTLRAYHKLLWDKSLPNGTKFTLEYAPERSEYLVHDSHLGRFSLASDTCVPGWSNWKRERIADIVREVSREELTDFDTLTYQMGAMLLFPRNGPGEARGQSMNQERGTNGFIVDRLDLTLECIRLYYQDKAEPGSVAVNPLADAINRWSDFFDLFGDFKGYTDFFLLQDLLTADGATVDLFLPNDGFPWWPFPADVDEYAEYRRRALGFVEERNRRMEDWVRREAGGKS